jgi:hypothetical protein
MKLCIVSSKQVVNDGIVANVGYIPGFRFLGADLDLRRVVV